MRLNWNQIIFLYTSFQICATPILQEIQSIFSTVVRLKAELCKLNIYARDDFLKAHVDTVHSEKIFGSLVVCLPTQFTGGELIVRHNQLEIKYDWSSTASTTSSTLHWAAFFNDVEQEVLPVSEGYRITLTYNLSYHSKASDLIFDIKTCSFYKLLQAALINPAFMRDGGVLGFNSNYSYVFDTQWADLLTPINTIEDKAATIERLDRIAPCHKFIQLSKVGQVRVLRDVGIESFNCQRILDALPSDSLLLKGADYIVAESAKSLGLPVYIKPFLSNNRGAENFNYVDKKFSKHVYTYFDPGDLYHGHYVDPMQMFGNALSIWKAQDITWCQKLLYHQLAGAAMHYGNQGSVDLWYESAAILIHVPNWSQFCQKLIGISTEECCNIEYEIVKGFKDSIQDDTLQGEIQELNKQIEALLENQFINAVQGLVAVLKGIQIKLNGCLSEQGHEMHLNKQAEIMIIHDIKDDLKWLNNFAKHKSIQSLHYKVERLKGKSGSLHC